MFNRPIATDVFLPFAPIAQIFSHSRPVLVEQPGVTIAQECIGENQKLTEVRPFFEKKHVVINSMSMIMLILCHPFFFSSNTWKKVLPKSVHLFF